MIKTVKKILNFLNSQADPSQIAIGAILGLFAAFLSPAFFNVIFIFLIALLLNCNFGVFFVCTGLFKILTMGVDPIGDIIGKWILTQDFLLPLWKTLSQIPILTLTNFNNTVIMGNFIIGVIFIPLIWIITIKSVEYYRKNLRDKVKKFKIMQILTGVDLIERGEK
ncbi:MAG: TIGR03546 family protein [Candidatus Goldbacteria bacterium]|nr:TIGR03546 family protein [Candidatus Goldiibacteriota bacterium]